MLPKDKCVGCSACKDVCPKGCITMQANKKGFLHPRIDAAICIECGACEHVCQVLNPVQKHKLPDKVYAAREADSTVLRNSSSGGIATALADLFLSIGGVVYGAAFDENMVVKHIRVSHRDELKRIQGSKYVQSDIQEIYGKVKQDLSQGLNVLVFGTPCQIAGLRKRFDQAEKLFLCDLICHSAPSPKVLADHLRAIETDRKEIADYRFRDKSFGWSYHLNRIQYTDGTSDLHTYWNQCYKRLFLLNLIARESCYTCEYSDCQRVSDLTLGDYWGIQKITHQFDDDKGVNVVFVNTDKGELMFRKMIESGIEYVQTTVQDALQAHLIMPCTKPKNAERFWEQCINESYEAAAFQFAGGYRYLTLRNRLKDCIYQHRHSKLETKRGTGK